MLVDTVPVAMFPRDLGQVAEQGRERVWGEGALLGRGEGKASGSTATAHILCASGLLPPMCLLSFTPPTSWDDSLEPRQGLGLLRMSMK